MPAEWAASVMEQLVHWTHFLFLGQAEGHPQQALPKIVPNYHGVGFACHDGSEFQTPAYLEPSGEGEKQVRYPSSLGRCDSVEGFYVATCTCPQPSWSPAAPLGDCGEMVALWALVLGDERSCVLEGPILLLFSWDLYKGTVLEMSKGNQAEITGSAWQKPDLTI